jgi:ubiquinone/menaquinone biosynthesis C-methylase UbiE
MRESGAAVADSLGITPEMRVLDLRCGDGTTALPMARAGADVTGIDIAKNLVQAGNRRATEAGLTRLRFYEGDACHLEGVADNSFDLVLSVFGAMFAPKPFDVAKEMVRVTKPGGRIVYGQLDSRRPDVCVAGAADQLGIHAAASGGLYQPNDVGRGEQHPRAVRPGWRACGENCDDQGHVLFHVAGPQSGAVH